MTILSKSFKRSSVMLELSWGDPSARTYLRRTNRSSSVSISGLRFDSDTELHLEKAKNIGTLGDRQMEVELRFQDADDVDVMTSGIAFPDVAVGVFELLEDVDTGARQLAWIFRGEVSEGWANPDGKEGIARLRLVESKARLGFSLGMSAGHLCQWTFGKKGCGIVLRALEETGTLTVADGKVVTVTGLADHSADTTGRYWHRGSLRLGGLSLLVRDWVQADPTRFVLQREPPPLWVGEDVTALPGCDKSIETCRARHDRESNFQGPGYAMTAYHPSFEDPY